MEWHKEGYDVDEEHNDILELINNQKQSIMKTGIVESAQGNGSFTNEHGTFYSFEYHLDNGDFGTANHKTDFPKYNIGDTVTYELKEDSHGIKMKFINPDFQNNNSNQSSSQSSAQPQQSDPLVGYALKYATMVKCAHIAKGEDFTEAQLREELEMMKNIMLGK